MARKFTPKESKQIVSRENYKTAWNILGRQPTTEELIYFWEKGKEAKRAAAHTQGVS